MPDHRTGAPAVAAGLLLTVSVAAELVHPVQAGDGTVLDRGLFAVYLALWVVGAALLVRAAAVVGGPGRAGRVGRVLTVSGAVLLLVFGVVVLATGTVGAPLEASFLAFAAGLLLAGAGALTLGLARRGTATGWALVVAGAGALVALLVEVVHDAGLFAFFLGWVAVGVTESRRARTPVSGVPR